MRAVAKTVMPTHNVTIERDLRGTCTRYGVWRDGSELCDERWAQRRIESFTIEVGSLHGRGHEELLVVALVDRMALWRG